MTAIIFDCDGVLVDSEIIAMRAGMRALKELGLTYDEDDFIHRHCGTTVAAYLKSIEGDHQSAFGKPLPDGFVEKLMQETKDEMNASLEAVPGVHDVVDSIQHPLAVASSSGLNRLHFKLKKTDLHHRFDPHIYSGDQVKKGKPAPDLFLFSAEQLGVHPEKCIAIEDSVNGVKSALAAGMTVIGFTGGSHCRPSHTKHLSDAGASVVANHMGKLLSTLEDLT